MSAAWARSIGDPRCGLVGYTFLLVCTEPWDRELAVLIPYLLHRAYSSTLLGSLLQAEKQRPGSPTEDFGRRIGHIGLGAEAVEAKPRRYTAVLSPCALSAVGRVALNRTMHPALRGEYERRT